MGFSLETSIPVLTVFVQGLLSFFSPCVLPLIPLYVGYLAGGAAKTNDDGTVEYPRKKVFVNTLFFVVGVSFAFFLLGFGFTALGQFFTGNQRVFSIVAGVIMAAFGLYMLGAFGKTKAVEKERRLPFRLNRFAMNPLVALVLGFTFSFAWTPCVGPVLASVLLMASSSASAAAGFGLVAVYTIGFVLPFLAVGLFTGEVLRFFRTHGNVVKYTVKVGGALLIVMGVMTVTGWMNGVTSYLSSFGGAPAAQEQPADQGADEAKGDGANGGMLPRRARMPARAMALRARPMRRRRRWPTSSWSTRTAKSTRWTSTAARRCSSTSGPPGAGRASARSPTSRSCTGIVARTRATSWCWAWRIRKPTAVPTTATCPKPT